jgi:hypothetical protein
MRPVNEADLWLCQKSPNCAGSLALGLPESSSQAIVDRTGLNRKLEIACPVCSSPMKVSRGVFLRAACQSEELNFGMAKDHVSSKNKIRVSKAGVG